MPVNMNRRATNCERMPRTESFTHGPSSAGINKRDFGFNVTDLYRLDGEPAPTAFNPEYVNLPSSRRFLGDEHAGIEFVGWYGPSKEQADPIVSILYHKITKERQLEGLRRLVIWQATGYGEFGTAENPAHIGQGDSRYIHGGNFGYQDPDDKTRFLSKDGVDLGTTLYANNFSFACIAGHQIKPTLLANHPSELEEMGMTWPELKDLGIRPYAAQAAGIEVTAYK